MTQIRIRLGEILTRERRSVSVDPTKSYEQIGVRSFGKGIFHKPPVSGADLGNKKIYEIREGDFILNIVFAWEGAVAIAGADENGKVASHRFPTYVPNRDRVDPRYLRAFFLADEGRQLLAEASPGSAGRNRTLNRVAFENLRIGLPGIDEQRRIGAWLDRIAEKAGALGGAQDRVHELASALTGSVLGGLEDSAPSVPLGGILTQVRDEVVVEPDQTYRPAGIYSFGRGLFARPPIQGSETKYRTFNRIRAEHFVYSKLGGWEGAVTVADPEFDGFVASAEYPTFKIDGSRATPDYLRWLCRWPAFWDLLRTRGSMARRKRTHPNQLLATKIPLPSLDEQRRLGLLGAKLAVISARGEANRETRAAILPAAINQVLGS